MKEDANITSAGCNIVQAVATEASREALEQPMKYWSNSVAVSPRLMELENRKHSTSLQWRGTLLFSSSAPACL